ncbi:hypothetical protein JCM1840_003418 [Sporobolomyces johnsonii]
MLTQSDQVAGIVSDNASNMAAMIDKIGTWVQCFGHILNLVTKSVLQPFHTKLAEGIPEHDAPYEPDLSPAEQAYIDKYSTHDCRFSLDKLQVIAKKLAYNPGARLLLAKICTDS